MKVKQQSTSRNLISGVNLGFVLKLATLWMTLFSPAALALPAFWAYCVLNQSNKQNFLWGIKKSSHNANKMTQYVIERDRPDLNATERILHLQKLLKEYYTHANISSDEHHFYLLASQQLGRALIWHGTLPDINAINTEYLLDPNSRQSRAIYAARSLILCGLYPYNFNTFKPAMDKLTLKYSIWYKVEKAAQLLYEIGSKTMKNSLAGYSKNKVGIPYRLILKWMDGLYTLQIGSQYTFEMQISKKRLILFGMSQSILIPILYGSALHTIIAFQLLAFLATQCLFNPSSHMRLSLGYHPYTISSELFCRNRDNDVSYNIGNITLNILANVLVISSLGFLCNTNIIFCLMTTRTLIALAGISCINGLLRLAYKPHIKHTLMNGRTVLHPPPVHSYISCTSRLIPTLHSGIFNLCNLSIR